MDPNEAQALGDLCESIQGDMKARRGNAARKDVKPKRRRGRRDDPVRNAALAALRQCRDREQIDTLIATLKPLRNTKEATMAIQSLGRVRNSRAALALHAEMDGSRKIGFDAIYVSNLISVCVKGGQWKRGVELYDAMVARGLKPNVFTCSAAISACDKGGQWQRALAILGSMPSHGVLPNVVVYNACISAMANAAEPERAIELLREMRRIGLPPDVVSYNAAISACDKAGRWDKAISLLYKMERRGVTPDVVSFSAAIAACEKGGRWERALELLARMERQGVTPNLYSFNSAIAACGASRQSAHLAVKLFERLDASPRLTANTVTFNAVLDVLTSMCKREEARGLWKLGVARGLYAGCEDWEGEGGKGPTLDLHDLSVGAADAAVRWWLEERVPERLGEQQTPGGGDEPRLWLVTGWGRHRAVHQRGDVRKHVEELLEEMGVTTLPTDNPGAHACLPSSLPAMSNTAAVSTEEKVELISKQLVAQVSAMRDEQDER